MSEMQKAISYALSDDDINKILEPDTSIFTYPALEDMRSIDDAFDPYGRAIMLYPTTDANTGHWVCMMRYPKHIEFFDPYGEKPDAQLKWVGANKRKELNTDEPFLTRLFRESGMPIYYNTYDYQQDHSDINTCGRHCVVRLLYKNKTPKQYYDMIKKSGLSPDEFVTGITYQALNK